MMRSEEPLGLRPSWGAQESKEGEKKGRRREALQLKRRR